MNRIFLLAFRFILTPLLMIKTKCFRNWLLVFSVLFHSSLFAQEIRYSFPQKDNAHATRFQIVGKCGRFLLIDKASGNDHTLAFYNDDMQLTEERVLDFLPKNIIETEFIACGNNLLLFYQYRYKRDIICEALLLDSLGKPQGKSLFVDKTSDKIQVTNNKWYGLLVSGNKERMMIYQVREVEDSLLYHISTFLFDNRLNRLQHHVLSFPMFKEGTDPDHFSLTNEGILLFTLSGQRNAFTRMINQILVYRLKPGDNALQRDPCRLEGNVADSSLLLKIDEGNARAWLLSFLYDEKQRHINALYCLQYDYRQGAILQQNISFLSDSLKQQMEDNEHGIRMAFDNCLLRDLVTDKSGNGLLVAEDVYKNIHEGLEYGNLALLKLNPDGRLCKGAVITKNQVSDRMPELLSYLLVNTGNALHFLFNRPRRVIQFLAGPAYFIADYRYNADGTVDALPLYRHLSKKRHWSPRNGVQIGGREAVIPCVQGSVLLFVKVAYPAL